MPSKKQIEDFVNANGIDVSGMDMDDLFKIIHRIEATASNRASLPKKLHIPKKDSWPKDEGSRLREVMIAAKCRYENARQAYFDYVADWADQWLKGKVK